MKVQKKEIRGKTVDSFGAAAKPDKHGHTDSHLQTKTELEDYISYECTNLIAQGMFNLREIVRQSHENEKEESTKVVIENEEIPKSMQEIYRISHRNRRQAKKTLTVSKEKDANESFDNLIEAEELLSKSGPDEKCYFGMAINKRQRPKDQTAEETKLMSNKDADIALAVEVGWVKSKEEAESLVLSRQSSTEETCLNDQKNNIKGDCVLVKHQTKQSKYNNKQSGSGSRNSLDPLLPCWYSNVSPMGIHDRKAPVPENPFFTGAAVSGGILNKRIEKIERKKSGNTNMNGKKWDGNKTHAYRNCQR